MCLIRLVPQSAVEIGTTQVVFHPKPKERSQKDRKHVEQPHRAGPSFGRPDPLSPQSYQYGAGVTKVQKNHISVKWCAVPVTGGIFITKLGSSHTALTSALRMFALPSTHLANLRGNVCSALDPPLAFNPNVQRE